MFSCFQIILSLSLSGHFFGIAWGNRRILDLDRIFLIEFPDPVEDEADEDTSSSIVKYLFFHSSNFSLMVFRTENCRGVIKKEEHKKPDKIPD